MRCRHCGQKIVSRKGLPNHYHWYHVAEGGGIIYHCKGMKIAEPDESDNVKRILKNYD